ncbi:uncharacterized peptidase C1-like protein F26E4.3 [Panulirus ornatus]|uniref:uncharacterized peptidase C1-like protein F26E4.3 n=1 Tax=Panulirus ornatus TaxID=150431 RepID=UPI003A87A0FE
MEKMLSVLPAKRHGGVGSLLPMVITLSATLVAILPLVAGAKGRLGAPVNYCRNRKPSECCTDRLDDCAVSKLGLVCYCDQFCLTSDPEVDLEDDCCPDFREVCLGEKQEEEEYLSDEPHSKPDCTEGGVTLQHGDTHKFNCNECTCDGGKLKCEMEECMIEKEVMEEVNSEPRHYGWKAANYTHFWTKKIKEGFLLRTGTLDPEKLSLEMYPIIQRVNTSLIPDHFDARRTRKEWRGRMSSVRDQGWCGASWVFSTLAVTQDRLSLLARGADPIQLSAQNLLSCANLAQHGCKGGHVERAWNYLRRKGVVQEACYRYESGTSGKVPSCHNPTLTCKDPDLYKMEPAYRISNNEQDIQWEIMRNGPVQAVMKVHRDFFMYKTGVYKFTGLTPPDTATHSVRIVGWGQAGFPGSQPLKYWVVANSWGQWWGMEGYFKILRGTNESGIESFILSSRGHRSNRIRGHKFG